MTMRNYTILITNTIFFSLISYIYINKKNNKIKEFREYVLVLLYKIYIFIN